MALQVRTSAGPVRAAHCFRTVRNVLLAMLVVLSGIHPALASYFFYKKPPKFPSPVTPELLSRSSKKPRSFEFRKNYAPGVVYNDRKYTKQLPPLDLRLKPETGVQTLREEFLADCANFISRELALAREMGNTGEDMAVISDFSIRGIYIPIVRNPELKSIKSPLRVAAARIGALNSPVNNNIEILEQFSGVMDQYTGIAVQNSGYVSLDHDHLSNLNMLVITSEREFRISEHEAANLARFLRSGGFAIIDFATGGRDAVRTVSGLIRVLSSLPGGKNQVGKILPDHPLWQTFFDLSSAGFSGRESETTASSPLYGVWLDGRLTAVCFCGARPSFDAVSLEKEQYLRIGVNALIYSLTRPLDAALQNQPR